MFKRIKYGIIAFIIIIISIIVYFCSIIDNKDKTSLNNEIQNSSLYNKDDTLYFDKLIVSVVKREIDWDTLPLTNNFKIKFANDIFGIKKDEVLVDAFYLDGFPYESDNNNRIMFLEIWKDTGEIFRNKIHYRYNEKYELDDMDLVEEQLIKNKEGSYLNYDTLYVYGHDISQDRNILVFLFNPFQQGRYDKFETTEHFKQKFLEVVNKEPIRIDRKYLFIDRLVRNGNVFDVYVFDETSHHEYEIEIIADANGAIDDMKYKYIQTFNGDTDNIEIYQNKIISAMDNEY